MSQTTDEKGQVLVKPDVGALEQKVAKGDLNIQEMLGIIILSLARIEIHLIEITEEEIVDGDLTEGFGIGR